MRYDSIADIYSANEKLRARFRVVASVTDEEATKRPDGELWSIAEIVEHVSIVDAGIARICAKLLESAKASGKNAEGRLAITEKFIKGASAIANEKLEAPDRVRPTGNVSVSESLEKMAATSRELALLRDDLEKFDLSGASFPHPYLGEMTAAEWLVMFGGHEARHAAQIERILSKIRQ